MPTRRFVLAGAAMFAAAGPAAAAPISLNALSGYLNGIVTAESPFTQISDDGTISTGQLYIQRPGRVRFDYSPPEETLVMAGGGQVAIFDGKSNDVRPEQYPLSRTPLSIILERNVDLSRRGMVVGHREDGVKTIVTAQDPENPDYGSIELVFTGNPIQLRQWVITDSGGAQTTVVLGDLRQVGALPARYFSIPTEVASRER